MHSDVVACFYKGLAGINVDEVNPGFKHTFFKPQFVETISYVQAEHETMYGRVASAWKRTEDGIIMEITVPQNCTGTLLLPAGWSVKGAEGNKKDFATGTHKFVLCTLNKLK